MSQDALHQDTFIDDATAADAVDAIIAQWRVEFPDLDPEAKHITGRVVRLGTLFQQAYVERYEELGLSGSDFGVLAPLRRAGEPYEVAPTELARHRMITSGGMTAAIDRLERKGLVARVPNPDDRRGSFVKLTADGKVAIDRAMELHQQTEQRLVAPLDDDERAQLELLLRKLLRPVDNRE